MSGRRRLPLVLGLMALCLPLAGAFLSWRARVRHTQAGAGLHALRAAVLQYAQDDADALPPMRNQAALRASLWPYAKSESAFRAFDDPARRFLPNPSGRRLGAIKTPTLLLYESRPSPADHSRWVAFLPENAAPSAVGGDPDFAGLRLVPEAEWRKLKAASALP